MDEKENLTKKFILVKMRDMQISTDEKPIIGTQSLATCVGVLIYSEESKKAIVAHIANERDGIAKEVFDKIKTCDILLIDDIGAETVTNWSRDEILGTILQYRMEHELSTFLTSNLTIEELETHLSLVKNNMDKVKARRIIERIKQLTTVMELISVNRRN